MRGGGAGSVLRVRIAAARAGGQRQQAGGTKSHERTSFHRDLLNSGDIVSLYNRAGILKIFMKVAPLPAATLLCLACRSILRPHAFLHQHHDLFHVKGS